MLQIELSRRYYEDVVKPALRQQLPAALDLCAFVDFFGDSGSFGWDDDISRDEDWGPRVMVIVPDDGPSSLYDDLLNIARELPTSVAGLEANERPDASSAGPSWTGPRMRLRRLSDHFIYGDPPLENLAWLRTDEHRLFAMVSGSVLNDPTGRFVSRLARWRRTYYPEDVWYHRLAGALRTTGAMIGSSDRLFARQDAVALAFSLGVALHDAMQVSFLINRQWAPFYKWRHRAFRFLPETPRQMEEFFERASTAESGLARIGALWKINDMLRQWLVDLGLAHSTRDELAVTADYLESRITDHAVRAAPPWDTLEQQRHWEWTTP